MSNNNSCPICGFSGCGEKIVPSYNAWMEVSCEDCGTVYFPHHLPENFFGSKPDTCFKMACLLYKRKLQGKIDPIAFYKKAQEKPQDDHVPYFAPCYEYKEWLKSFPADPLAKIDDTLLNFKDFIGKDLTKTIDIASNTCTTEDFLPLKIMFCESLDSAHELASLMEELGYISHGGIPTMVNLSNSGASTNRYADGSIIKLTAKGWQRISELRDKQAENSETCFVAMQFHDSMDPYRTAVKDAAKQSGYKVVFADKDKHNDFIMDKVINAINEARFVIADFTTMPEDDKNDGKKVSNGVRGGVYWEAGYARGLGREVIHTRKDDEESRRRLHFDVEQINTLFWDNDSTVLEKFTEKLFNRIKATVGKGPLPVD